MKKLRPLFITILCALLSTFFICPDEITVADSDSGLSKCQVESETPTFSTIIPEISYSTVDETVSANDSIGTAQTISTNTIVTGTLDYPPACTDCDDYYTIPVSEGDEFIVQLSGPPNPANFDLYLYDGSNFSVFAQGSVSEEKLTYTIPAGMSDFIILVNAYDGSGTYTLTVTTPATPIEVENVQGDECKANMQGVVSNAVDSSLLTGAVINLRAKHDTKTGDIDASTTSGSNGAYSFEDLIAGYYTAEIILADYITIYQDLTLEGKTTAVQGFSMSPTLDPGEVRIILTWGASPNILDSYLEGPKTSSGTFRINYQHMDESANGASLDRDDTTAFGPETITITSQNSGTYTYWVDNYSASHSGHTAPFSDSGAIVNIYDEDGHNQTVKVPTGAGDKWTVFTMTDGEITVVNTLSTQ